jgi:Zn-dependent peptidase ImmA (M78 family)/transcriptional regulator with XRE-family HTH domain
MMNIQLQLDLGMAPSADALGTASAQFNLSMLNLAREAKGCTQKDLAHLMGCKQSRVSKIESGELVPHESDVQMFVKILGQAREFFFQQAAAMPASVSFYRKTQTFPLKLLRQCNAQMNIRRLQIENRVGEKRLGARQLPHMPPDGKDGARVVARQLRKTWGLKPGPIPHLAGLVEDAGCVIVDYAFPSLKLDGLCLRAPDKLPIIFLNKDLPKSRRRLSLAHELGHLVMHVNPHENVEDEAWDFASEFMMPSAEIEKEFSGLNLDRLGELKKKWGLSMQAILYWAQKLNNISESYSRFLWMQIGKCGYRLDEPFEDAVLEERPTELDDRLKAFT